MERYVGIIQAILIASVLFVFAHAANALCATQWPFYFLCSVFFGFVAWRTDSMLWPICAHAMINLVANLLVLRYGSLDRDTFQGGPAVALFVATVLGISGTVLADRKAVLAKYSRDSSVSG